MSTEAVATGTKAVLVPFSVLVALSVVFASVTNVYGSRFGTLPDLILLGAAVLAFAWLVANGIEAEHTASFMVVLGVILALYVSLSIYDLSYRGLRNAVSLFSVASIFLFFFCASKYLLTSRIFLGALIVGFGLLTLVRLLPLDVAKNMLNSAMCYYLILIFLCLTGVGSIRFLNVAMLFAATFVVSLLNDHRTLAGLSVLLTFQYLVLRAVAARRMIRNLMFAGIVATGAAVVALLVNPRMLIFAEAFNSLVQSEGERTIMSGRQVIWPAIWAAILRHPVLGLDPGASTGDLYATTLSAHNFFLEIGMQLGFTGIVLFLIVFWSLWRMAYPSGMPGLRGAEDFMTVIVTMVITHCLFDVFLTQDSLAVGVPVWMALGLGLGGLRAIPANGFLASRWALVPRPI